jgi:hypothetical protein
MSPVPHRLRKLQARHYVAIGMRLDGRSSEAIAEALGVKLRTVYIWFSDPLVKTELDSQQRELRRRFREKIAEAALAGASVLADVAQEPIEGPISAETKLRAVRLILERLPPSVFDLQPCSVLSPEVTRLIAEMSPSERVEFSRELAKDVLGVTEEQLRSLDRAPQLPTGSSPASRSDT